MAHEEIEMKRKQLIKNFRAELDAVHQTLNLNAFADGARRVKGFKEMGFKYPADVHTSRQEAEKLGQVLNKEMQTKSCRMKS